MFGLNTEKKKKAERDKQIGHRILYQNEHYSDSKLNNKEIIIKNEKFGFWHTSYGFRFWIDAHHVCPFREGLAKINKTINNENKSGFIAGPFNSNPNFS